MSTEVRYHTTGDRPTLDIWWFDAKSDLVDFSSGYTWQLLIGNPGSAALFTKTTGITGAAGEGIEPTGTPNIVIAWTADERAALLAGTYTYQLTPTTGGLSRDPMVGQFVVPDVIT